MILYFPITTRMLRVISSCSCEEGAPLHRVQRSQWSGFHCGVNTLEASHKDTAGTPASHGGDSGMACRNSCITRRGQ
ncbi:hypothetical protein FKM82_022531 [Ascaphus truei]